ncbi:MAG: 6-phosphogluconolactonase [Ornithinimicrobium sp.]
MIVDLPSTTTGTISKRLVSLRNEVGAMTMGRVLTLLVLVEETGADEAIAAANDATRQHPARIIVVVRSNRRGAQRLDAQIRLGGDAGASEIVVLRLYGALADHGDAVVTPLLLPDSPIVGWWPGEPPANVADSALGQLAHRRITDAAPCAKPARQLKRRAQHYRSGDTDLTWTRITRWRALLAATLDYPPYEPVTAATVSAEPDCASADLLAGWLSGALGISVVRARSAAGTGLVSVRMQRASGPIDLIRVAGQVASLSQPGQPTREVALLEPGLPESLAAELRRLDADQVYAAALCRGLAKVSKRSLTQSEAIRSGEAPEKPGRAQTQSSGLGSRALNRTSPKMDSPPPERLQEAVDERLSDVQNSRLEVHADKQALAAAVADRVVEVLAHAVEERGVAHVCLTGGSMGSEVVAALAHTSAGAQWWSQVHVWWGDERFVPRGDADRNDQQADDAGLGSWGVPSASVHRLLGARSDGKDDRDDLAGLPAASMDYAAALASLAEPIESKSDVPSPTFDVMLLGLGPDTHIASLFPGRDEVTIDDPATTTVAVTDSPKPPPLRVSLTVPALQKSRSVFFIVAGADKSEAVKVARAADSNDPDVPASWVRGQQDTVWWLDAAASGDSSPAVPPE